MFAFLKSAESLETKLRAWALQDAKCVINPSEWAEMIEGLTFSIATTEIKDLAAEVATRCVSKLERDKANMILIGKVLGMKETWRHSQGVELVKDLAKKKGWRVSFKGSSMCGFQCTID